MKRRLNMAVALVHDPQVLLLDEPTVGVDPQSRNHIFDRIEQLAHGRTFLYTTHYMEEAQRLCDRVAIMDHGKILALDTVNRTLAEAWWAVHARGRARRIPDGVSLPASLEGNMLRFASDQPFEEANRLRNAGIEFRSLSRRSAQPRIRVFEPDRPEASRLEFTPCSHSP